MENIKIVYKNIKNLKLALDTGGNVVVTSPRSFSKKEIFDILQTRKAWIEKHRNRIVVNKKYNYNLYNLDQGSQVFFLGKEYTVELIESKQNLLVEKERSLVFYLNSSVISNRKFKLILLEEFYRDKADIILNNLVAKYLKITNQEVQKVVIKKVKTRWGSCNHTKKIINLNVDLVLRDIQAIEYVILHEVAHLTHPNHSKDFYSYVANYMPDWKVREKSLK
ncbi:M48 family metallopeptidase [Allofrancisella guangzhouensis]|uniref:Metal-dependent hydrolase n=1 Tax=Allofrancisella guangzhouensis TaxID=594679 RepID=A0A0A8E4I1_9GAMM|nr:SprT family zinc-dependent metalloprotease [Allofrancisella guangzhouensis]AJC48884.1 metal-dependent hydrolase [Allofrancisella guangzhouensis]MBK2027425.1 M48 family metallopeptidase [Allofrancisella guangzhouensis]MBK2043411.1 M48 family metallopeptidase [Allofrancisella guangzhouensis]MBK2045836.1 M48 family metallopeptidase [Allofrancisella guangzhouensis]